MTTNQAGQPARSPAAVTVSQILRFYVPLVLTSQLMTLSGPVINVAIGRATDPTLDFAAFWIAFTIVLFIESACLATQQTTLALSEGSDSLGRLVRSALAIGLASTGLVLLAALTPLGDLIFRYVIPTTPRVADLARHVMILFAPLPTVVAIRGVANGLAIRAHRTPLVAAATVVRVLGLSSVAGAAVWLHTGSGALAGGWALLTGMSLETAFIIVATRHFWMPRLTHVMRGTRSVSYAEILRVAAPLAIAMLAWTTLRPVVNGVLGHLPDPELAQAGFGIVLPVIMFSCSPLWALHNVSLVLPHDRDDLARVIRFTIGLAGVFAVAIGLVVLTPVKLYVLRIGFNLSPELEASVAPALVWIVLEPFALAAKALSMGLLMKARRTKAFLVLSPIKIALIILVGFAVAIQNPGINGALLGGLLYIGADVFDAVTFGFAARHEVNAGRVFEQQPRAYMEEDAESVIPALPLDDD